MLNVERPCSVQYGGHSDNGKLTGLTNFAACLKQISGILVSYQFNGGVVAGSDACCACAILIWGFTAGKQRDAYTVVLKSTRSLQVNDGDAMKQLYSR